jgi:aspartyl-tRNA(Asn)/glutamyl-tRNA(Gln) amidotransferase subunit A
MPPDSQPLLDAASEAGNAFIAYNGDAKYMEPTQQSLTDAVGEEDSFKHMSAVPKNRYKLAVKDNICTLGFPTTCASHALEGYQSPYEATVVSLLKRHGAKIVGKTNMDEFGMGSHSTHSRFGPVVQRHTQADGNVIEYSPGGSSGGSALAVAKHVCEGALGTDTGGSVRLPAAYCGVVGFKPSYGLVSRWGVIDYANSFDTVGFFASSSAMIHDMFGKLLSFVQNKSLISIHRRGYLVRRTGSDVLTEIRLTSKAHGCREATDNWCACRVQY